MLQLALLLILSPLILVWYMIKLMFKLIKDILWFGLIAIGLFL